MKWELESSVSFQMEASESSWIAVIKGAQKIKRSLFPLIMATAGKFSGNVLYSREKRQHWCIKKNLFSFPFITQNIDG